MLVRPTAEDLGVIAYHLGRIFVVVGTVMALPLAWSVLDQEWGPAASFLLTGGIFLAVGSAALLIEPREEHLGWSHGMVVVALAWLLVPAVGAVPLALSGHFVSPLDAYFDAMSGITTTGLTLVQDLDHLAPALNFWRHLLHFLGGQGIVIAALSLFSGGGLMTLFHGEGRDERILPSVSSTARFIWVVSLLHLFVGVSALALVGVFTLGFEPVRAVFHGLMIFMAAFDTGGFSPQSTSIGYYHSAIFEMVTLVLMVAGALSFGIHFALWRGPRRGILRNLETRTLLTTMVVTITLTFIGLGATGAFTSLLGMTRQGFFQVISAHTGTGFSTLAPVELASWSGLAFGGLTLAMALGGMSSSTAGGVKSLRVGISIRSVVNQIKEVLLPERAVIPSTYWHNGRRPLTPALAQAALTVALLYVGLYLFGAGMGIAYGVPLQQALFESVSAAANVGLSVGVTDSTMPVPLKVTYIIEMWAGRLEFVAAFSMLGFLWAWVRGK